MICEGSTIHSSTISNSILGFRSLVKPGCVIADSYILGGEDDGMRLATLEIGENCVMRKAIVDRNATIGDNVRLLNKDGVIEGGDEASGILIRDGIVAVLKNAHVPSGTVV